MRLSVQYSKEAREESYSHLSFQKKLRRASTETKNTFGDFCIVAIEYLQQEPQIFRGYALLEFSAIHLSGQIRYLRRLLRSSISTTTSPIPLT